MFRKNIVFIIAIIGMISAGIAVKKAMTPPPKLPPVAAPSEKPYKNSIAASGIIEAFGENISLGSPQNGIVQEVFVEVWQNVKKGDPIFQLDDRELQADLQVALAKEEVAEAQHTRIHDQLLRLRSIKDSRAISQDELRTKENDEKVAYANLRQAIREKEKVATLLDRQTVRSPIDGIVIQKNIKKGEYISSQTDTAPFVIGNMQKLQVRADIDEQNASHMPQSAKAIANPKNRPGYSIPLTFVRIEPYVVPKKSLTGSSKEKVDTRVLQVIYTFDPPADISMYIGQQVDVYIDRAPLKDTHTAELP